MTKQNPRQGRPRKELKASLRTIKQKDWEALSSATILALFEKRYSVWLRVNYLLKFPKGFPSFKIEQKDGLDNIIKIRTKSLMRYLIAEGHTTTDMYQLQQAQRSFTLQQKEFDNLFQDVYDDVSEEYLGEEDNEQLD